MGCFLSSSRLVGGLAERPGLGQFASRLRHIAPLPSEIVPHRPAQTGVDDMMRGVGGLRQVTASDLVLALRAGFHPLKATLYRDLHCLIVADLEMQERMVLDGAPVAAEQGLRADEIDRAGN